MAPRPATIPNTMYNHVQPKKSTITPPANGERIVATPTADSQMPIMAPCRVAGKNMRIKTKASGYKADQPIPWSTRQASNHWKLGARGASNPPAARSNKPDT